VSGLKENQTKRKAKDGTDFLGELAKTRTPGHTTWINQVWSAAEWHQHDGNSERRDCPVHVPGKEVRAERDG
jgi:hypothetical protein